MNIRPPVSIESEKLIPRVRQELRLRRYRYRTKQAYRPATRHLS